MTRPYIVIGAGAHGVVLADALLSAGERVLGFTDPDGERYGHEICGVPVLGDDDVLERYDRETVLLANGIGGVGRVTGEPLRRLLQERLAAQGWTFGGVRHPSAVVSPFATVAADAQLLARSTVQVGATVESGCIVNTAAVVEHHAYIGSWVHVSPGVVILGDVSIGARSHVGAGAVVRQGIRIGEDTVIGAGAVVVKDFEGGGLLVGVPARVAGTDR